MTSSIRFRLIRNIFCLLLLYLILKGTNNLSNISLKAPSFALLVSRYILRLGQSAQKQQRPRCPNCKMYLEIRRADEWLFKAPSFALLISGYILRLGQAEQKQQRPCCPNPKMYLEIRRADERHFRIFFKFYLFSKKFNVQFEQNLKL